MKIKKTFGAELKDIKSKKFNIFIGISLGNEWFTKENLKEYLDWTLRNTKRKIVFLIADKIHCINYRVRSGYSEERSLRKALENGEKVRKTIIELISELPQPSRKNVKILDWSEYEEGDELYGTYSKKVFDEFKNNCNFRKEIIDLMN